MNRHDETDHIAEQVRAIDFCGGVAARGGADGVATGRHGDVAMASSYDLVCNRCRSFRRLRIHWLAGMASLIPEFRVAFLQQPHTFSAPQSRHSRDARRFGCDSLKKVRSSLKSAGTSSRTCKVTASDRMPMLFAHPIATSRTVVQSVKVLCLL